MTNLGFKKARCSPKRGLLGELDTTEVWLGDVRDGGSVQPRGVMGLKMVAKAHNK
jgi:hypothetical protein